MRKFLADWAHRRARANLWHCENVEDVAAQRHFLHRSYFWGDVEVWIEGLETWSNLRRRRVRLMAPRVRTPNTLGIFL